MIEIKLPEGQTLAFREPIVAYDVAKHLHLAPTALAAKVDGQLVDLSHPITASAAVQIVTAADPEGLEVLRHSTAHLLAAAVKALYPEAQITIGPVIADGFYYDFALPYTFVPEDLARIEAKMQHLVKAKLPIVRQALSRAEAIALFEKMGEHYKVAIIESIPDKEVLSFYQQGDFIDLCRGPHVPHTGHLGIFKLTKLAGAYWRGDANNAMLQRIYGTAWSSQEELTAYLTYLAEAEKRDHRKIAKSLTLFHQQPEAPGMVFWHPNGWIIYQAIKHYLRDQLSQHGYQEVHTPHMMDRTLWQKSGHWDKFHKEMFITETENHTFAIKPMNCPGHIQIFNQRLRSYRELPLRLAEFGHCHRCEPSGSLHGLMRVRHFVQDDAHIFCTEEHIHTEIEQFIRLLWTVYAQFGFKDIIMKLSTRPVDRIGADAIWDKAEHLLQSALETLGHHWTLCSGEGAFYGPKIEFSLKDCLGRIWQCGTIQLDFSMPALLGAHYIDAQGQKQVPIMLHRAILGSIERFIGILLEHYSGRLPFWLAPVQVAVLTITDQQHAYAAGIGEKLRKDGLRVDTDLRNEKIGFKIREHTLQQVPLLVIIGKQEEATQQVTVRRREGDDLGQMSIEQFLRYTAPLMVPRRDLD